MHIHLPKPLHGWRELAGEVGIIVLGVVIALGLEQIASRVHDATSERAAREAIHAEIKSNLGYMKARMMTQACVERRLDEISSVLGKSGDGAMSPQPRWIGQPAIWFDSEERWQAATASGRASLFSADEQSRLGAVYVATKQFLAAEEREQDAWAQLRGLESWTGPLGSAGRVHFIAALQSARLELWETSIDAKIAFQRAQALGLRDFTPKAMLEGYALPHAVCLPIDTPRDRALRILNGNSGIGGQPK